MQFWCAPPSKKVIKVSLKSSIVIVTMTYHFWNINCSINFKYYSLLGLSAITISWLFLEEFEVEGFVTEVNVNLVSISKSFVFNSKISFCNCLINFLKSLISSWRFFVVSFLTLVTDEYLSNKFEILKGFFYLW